MEVWYNLSGIVVVLLTVQCVVGGRNAAYGGVHPKRSQDGEEGSTDGNGMLDIYKTAKELEDLHETLQDVIKVLDIIGKKEKDILGEGKVKSAAAEHDDTHVRLSLIHPKSDSVEKATPSKLDIDTSVLGLELARILSQKENRDKIIQMPPDAIPAKKSVIADPHPRRIDSINTDEDGDDDKREERMFKRILTKYMTHQLEKDGLQLM